MEPMLPAPGQKGLEDMSMELAKKGSALAGTLHPIVQKSIGDLVRSMNCYYSNLIEGHDTHPRDIDKAMDEDFSVDPEKRDLQLEAKAHIQVQEMIDKGESPRNIPSQEFLLWVHYEFCSRLPESLLWVADPKTGKKLTVIAGEIRTNEVIVGKHVPPLAANLHRFLTRFEEAYSPQRLSGVQQVIAIAASHHRFAWIHPFLDGNGRVARLYSHAYFLHTDIGCSLWSVSRGLARNVEQYKAALMAADPPSKGQQTLIDFCSFFLGTCIDQVDFMSGLLSTDELLNRMDIYIKEEVSAKRLLKGSFALLREALYAGEFKRSKAEEITGYQERQARKVLTRLVSKGYLISDTERGAVRLGFNHDALERWLPRLYPVAF
jgi:Fic family protein